MHGRPNERSFGPQSTTTSPTGCCRMIRCSMRLCRPTRRRAACHRCVAAQGQFLHLLVRMIGARRSSKSARWAAIRPSAWPADCRPMEGWSRWSDPQACRGGARKHPARRLGRPRDRTCRSGPETLPKLEAERAGPFDLVFIDADKPGKPVYLDWAVKLGRPGAVIVLDNVIRDGKVIRNENSGDAATLKAHARGLISWAGHPRLKSHRPANCRRQGLRRVCPCDRRTSS